MFFTLCFALFFQATLGFAQDGFPLDHLPKSEFEEKVLGPLTTHKSYSIAPGSSVLQSLNDSGIRSTSVYKLIKLTKPVYNLGQIQAGTKFSIVRNHLGQLQKIIFHLTNINLLEIEPVGLDSWAAKLTKLPTKIRYARFSGQVNGSLWSSGVKAKLPPYLIVALAEVFAWKVDFSREVRKGDNWKFTIERIFSKGKHVGWGKLVFAEYNNQTINHKAYYYESPDGKYFGYFDDSGDSLRRMFLKSPIKFGRVTSRFSRRRFHPIQKRYKVHKGVDYGAPRGTPIRAIGDGRVTRMGRMGGAGKVIMINHAAGYQTRHFHLSRYQKGLRVGSRVEQGSVIGFVGKTGLATGPHLHFELVKNGRHVDPLKVDIPSAKPIPAKVLADFKTHINKTKRWLASLEIEEGGGSHATFSTPNN